MDHCARLFCSDPKYCSVATQLSPNVCCSSNSHLQKFCGCSAQTHGCVTCHHSPHRCLYAIPHPPASHVTCKTLGLRSDFPSLTPLTLHETVLARRHHDGFYYLGTVMQEEEHGVFLIEFNNPCTEGERFASRLQKTQTTDIVQYYEALSHSVLPGDNVLAPWEPELVRYGPGTVTLGLETRDPIRASEDEDLTISFWNGKKRKVPFGVAIWISPSAYRRATDLLHNPISGSINIPGREPNTTTYVITDRFTTVPVPLCPSDHLYCKPQCRPHYTHQHCSCCCFPTRSRCTCCYDPKCPDWWSLSPRTTVYVEAQKANEKEDEKIYRSRKQSEETSRYVTSSETDSREDDDENGDESDNETWISKATQTTTVDSAVNTDPSLWDKPRLGESDRPEWKYWKHSQPKYLLLPKTRHVSYWFISSLYLLLLVIILHCPPPPIGITTLSPPPMV
ncbi:hypothetical protein GDO86_008946 [Hymenochirus boettgeri]|uniref:DUF4537 domain-containing protein n=1 Tax=Hymenochirus boettgeri TaxID=247094 RepID=A0A8T2J483_9PIPI|nr:hypothetical protein GDO86_008946 [Hymenochirus boettgeri]